MNATPVPESSPRLPNTIDTMFTRGAERFGDVVLPTVVDGLLERPRTPHGFDRAPQLLAEDPSGNRRRCGCARAPCTPRRDCEARPRASSASVSTPAVMRFDVSRCSNVLHGHAEHDVGVHLDEAAIRVVGEARVSARSREARNTVRSLRPRLRIVSIMPGIDTGAPERTETSSGFFGSPKPLARTPARAARRFVSTSARSASAYVPRSR